MGVQVDRYWWENRRADLGRQVDAWQLAVRGGSVDDELVALRRVSAAARAMIRQLETDKVTVE